MPLLAPGTLPRGRESFRILHISDFHMLAHQQLKQEWVAALDTVEPDLVVNTGDNLGEAEGVPGVLRAVDPLLRRPGVFVFGSNDYFAPRPVNPFIYLLGKIVPRFPAFRMSLVSVVNASFTAAILGMNSVLLEIIANTWRTTILSGLPSSMASQTPFNIVPFPLSFFDP